MEESHSFLVLAHRSIFVWRAGSDGRYQLNIPIPVAPMTSNQHRVKMPASVGNWTAVCWSDPKTLMASSSWGELISWDLSSGSKKKPTCKLLHAHHTRGLFCIANVPRKTPKEEENWRESTPLVEKFLSVYWKNTFKERITINFLFTYRNSTFATRAKIYIFVVGTTRGQIYFTDNEKSSMDDDDERKSKQNIKALTFNRNGFLQ